MGDRANCVVRQHADDPAEIFLYTHWNGTELPELVQKALRRNQRWQDPSYLTRIIFDTMTDGQHGRETGFGIGVMADDNTVNRPYVVVDIPKQEVRYEMDDDNRTVKESWSFADFCTLDLSTPDNTTA